MTEFDNITAVVTAIAAFVGQFVGVFDVLFQFVSQTASLWFPAASVFFGVVAEHIPEIPPDLATQLLVGFALAYVAVKLIAFGRAALEEFDS